MSRLKAQLLRDAPELLVDAGLFDDFCAQLSCSLNVVDALTIVRTVLADPDPVLKPDPVVLKLPDPALRDRLLAAGYLDFINCVLQELRIPATCADVFRSELDDNLFEFLSGAIGAIDRLCLIERVESDLVLRCPSILSDLVMVPIGRLHHEVLLGFGQFTEMIDAVGGVTSKLFLNAKSPTAESQFIQIWIAARLGIATAQGSPDDLTAVA